METVKAKRLPKVRVVEALPSTFIKKVDAIGLCKANRVVRVSSEESGVIREVTFDKGDSLKQGALMLSLDDTTLMAALGEVEANYEIAKLNYEKLHALKEGRGAVSEFDLKNATLKQEMAAAKADVFRARLEKMRIASPIKGIVERKFVEAGEFVSVGAPVAEIVDTSTVKIAAGIAEKEASYFREGAEAEVVFDAYPGKSYKGRIDYVSAGVDESSGTFSIEISLQNKKGLFKPGMMTRVKLEKERCEACILLSQDALLDREDGTAIFVIDAGKRARLRPVTIGESNQGRVVIEKGVKAGEKVAVVGNKGLVDGELVEIVE